jgi:hypothetical protein
MHTHNVGLPLTLITLFQTQVEGGAADEGTWEGLRRKYWHGRTEYYLPIATFVGEEEEEGEGMEVGTVEWEQEQEQELVGSQSATADDTLVRWLIDLIAVRMSLISTG